MNLEAVVERFSLITCIRIENCSNWIPICKDSINEIRKRLKKGIDEDEHSRRLEVAAAALAYYKHALYTASNISAESFTAGEIKIKTDLNGSVRMAYRIWQEAEKSIADLLEDENFIFEGIAFDA